MFCPSSRLSMLQPELGEFKRISFLRWRRADHDEPICLEAEMPSACRAGHGGSETIRIEKGDVDPSLFVSSRLVADQLRIKSASERSEILASIPALLVGPC